MNVRQAEQPAQRTCRRPRPRHGLIALSLFAAALVPTAAFAGDAVELRSEPISHSGSITLGDLFDGASGQAAQVIVSRAPTTGLQAVLEASRIQMIARNAGLDWSNAQGLHRIIVTAGVAGSGPQAHAARARTAAHRRAAQTLVYARNVMAGDIVSVADLEWSDDAISASDSPGDPDAVVGKAARRPLRAGAAVQMHDLASPRVVRRDDMVNVAFANEGVFLVLEARAMADATVGDTISVINLQSKKVIEAVVSGPGRALVGPQADALKASAFDPSIRTASLR